MAHNTSREEQARELAKGTPRSTLKAGFRVTLFCAGCLNWRDPDYVELALRGRFDNRWRGMMAKMRCSCGELGVAALRLDWGREHVGVLRPSTIAPGQNDKRPPA